MDVPRDGEVVVVTGAAGFLGLKVVELLSRRGQNIREIRGFDICSQQPTYFFQNHDSDGKIKLTYIQGDIRNFEEVCGKCLQLWLCQILTNAYNVALRFFSPGDQY